MTSKTKLLIPTPSAKPDNIFKSGKQEKEKNVKKRKNFFLPWQRLIQSLSFRAVSPIWRSKTTQNEEAGAYPGVCVWKNLGLSEKYVFFEFCPLLSDFCNKYIDFVDILNLIVVFMSENEIFFGNYTLLVVGFLSGNRTLSEFAPP